MSQRRPSHVPANMPPVAPCIVRGPTAYHRSRRQRHRCVAVRVFTRSTCVSVCTHVCMQVDVRECVFGRVCVWEGLCLVGFVFGVRRGV